MNLRKREHHIPLKVSKLLCVVSLLFAASAATALPTAGTDQQAVLTSSLSDETPCRTCSIAEETFRAVSTELAELGKEFLTPPASSAALSNAQANLVKPLPAVPAALLMALTGFLCVSLVKDRRLWLAALAGMLWAGQVGIQNLPQLALRLSHRIHSKQELGAEPAYLHYLENSDRLRSDIEGTQYIGLLHHLAGIPDNKSAYRNIHLAELIASSQYRRKPFGKAVTYPRKDTLPYLSAIISEQYRLNSLFKRLAVRAKQFSCFSPAFIFAELPRGPPKLA